MKKILFALLLVSGIASAQYSPTSSKTRWINGVGLSSTRDTSLFTSAADTNIVTTWNGNIYWKGTGYWNKIGHSTNVGAQIHDSLYAVYQLKAGTSAGARLVSNSGTVISEWGLGGSANMDFHGFAGYDANRSASYTARSFTDKNYVDSSRALDVQLAGTQTITGAKTFASKVVLSANPLNDSTVSLEQTMATNDTWRIYGVGSTTDYGEMVFQVGDNGKPFYQGGERFRFSYDSTGGGVGRGLKKDVFFIDYDTITTPNNITALSFYKKNSTNDSLLLGGGGIKAISDFALLSGANFTGNVGIGGNPVGQLSLIGASSDAWASSGASALNFNGNNTISTISTYLDGSSIRIGAGVTHKTGILIGGTTSGTGSAVEISTTGTTRLSVNSTGDINISSLGTGTVYSNSGTLTNTNPSDSTLKNSIKPLSYGLAEVLKLQPKTFYYNSDNTKSSLKYGFIAQEVKQIMPDVVREFNTYKTVDSVGIKVQKTIKKLGLESDGIYVTLVKAIQEQQAIIDDLKKRIIALENK